MNFHVSTYRTRVWAPYESVAETIQKQERSAKPEETSSARVHQVEHDCTQRLSNSWVMRGLAACCELIAFKNWHACLACHVYVKPAFKAHAAPET